MSKYVGKIVTNQAPAGYSVYFDGNGDTLLIANNAALNVGAGDFCIETWFYFSSTTVSQIILSNAGAFGSDNTQIDTNSSSNIRFASSATVWLTSSGTPTINSWNHVAVSRSGTTLSMFVNGSRQATATNSTNFANANNYSFAVGAAPGYAAQFTGYVSNIRVVKGSSVYDPTQTSIRVPTQFLRITNTQLLTCNSPAIVDQSSNAFAITVNGNAAVSTFTPFTAYVPYNPALGASTPGVWTLDEAMQARATRQWNMYDPSFQNTTLLLHGNGTNGAQNNTFLDSSTNNFTITRNGNTTQGSFSPFSQAPGAWSGYFDGSGDYLSIADNAALDLGAGDFCVEAFVYPTGDVAYSGIAGKNNGSGDGWFLEYSATRGLIAIWETSNSVSSATAYTKNSWQHIVFCRSGSTVSLYKDGIRLSTTTSTATIAFAAACTIGVAAGGGVFPGYISNARIVKGSSPYNAALSTLTVPTAPLTAITNTQLLTCQSNRFIDNSSNAFAITVNGNTSVQAFSPFLPTAAYSASTVGGSGYFDGTGDYLTLSGNTNLALGSGNFTIELWVNITSFTTYGTFATTYNNTPVAGTWFLRLNASTQQWQWQNGSDGGAPNFKAYNSSTNLIAGAWHHLAVVRSSGVVTLYQDGVNVGGGTDVETLVAPTFWIGQTINGYPMNGYISNLRVLKGTAQYTAAFTPPTAPLTAITNTQLLTNFTNAGITDATAKNDLETVGNAQISTTQSKFGGSSMYFDGTGDWLQGRISDFTRFAGDFTVECWTYVSTYSNYNVIFDTRISGVDANGIALGFNSSGNIYAFTTSFLIQAGTASTNAWNHVAWVRSGSTLTAYLNGVSVGTASLSTNLSSGNMVVGKTNESSSNFFVGYIDDLRVTKFARYTANFTPQTSQWQDQ